MKRTQTLIATLILGCVILSFAHAKIIQPLAAVNNPEGYQAPEGSIATLLRKGDLCEIQIILYGETNKIFLLWQFNSSKLLRATRITYTYTNGGLAMYEENKDNFAEYRSSSEKFNPQDIQVQKEFKRVREFFPTALVRCSKTSAF